MNNQDLSQYNTKEALEQHMKDFLGLQDRYDSWDELPDYEPRHEVDTDE